MGGHCRHKLIVSVNFAKKMQYRDTQIYWWTLALQAYTVVSSKFTQLAIQRYADLWVDVGAKNLQCRSLKIYKVYKTKIHKFMRRRWRYKLIVFSTFTKGVDVSGRNLKCPYIQNLQYKTTQIYGWTLALQTYSVRKLCNKEYRDTQIYGWTLALQTYSVRKVDKLYNTTELWVDAGVTNL